MPSISQLALFGLSATVVSAYNCVSFTVPVNLVNVSAEKPAFKEFNNSIDSVQFLNDITARVPKGSPDSGPTKVSFQANIAAQYCKPESYKHSDVVQVLTHGIGFDRSYWDFGGPDSQYNYIKFATAAGYATLSYDRLGTGKSSKGNPYTQQQLGPEAAILATLTGYLRQGALSKYANSVIPRPKKVVHVGHSFGSVISETFAGNMPNMTDGVVLTGFSTVKTYSPDFAISSNLHIASETDPSRFGAYKSKGFLTWGDKLSNQYSFFEAPFFAPEVLEQAEKTKQPFAVSEFLSAGATKAPNYRGPLLIISGSNDRIFCGSVCEGLLEGAKEFYPNAKPFATYIQPNTGHGMNLHFNATGTYGVITKFVSDNVHV